MDTIREQGERMDRYVQNLLDMTRLGHGALRPRLAPVAPADLVGMARRRLGRALCDHLLEVDLAPGLPPLLADPVLAEQALINLLNNAAKYAPSGTPIRVGADGRGDRVVLTVADEGPGIPDARRERVFDVFQRPEAGDRGPMGTGLGLAIARGLLEAQGDSIHAEAARPDGTGARLVVALPLAAGASSGPGAPSSGREGRDVSGARILVVEDEAPIRRFLRIALEAEGHHVSEADTAREGIRLAALDGPAAVILDLGLPDADGLAVLRSLREWSQVPVLVLSVRSEEGAKVAALDAGAQDYVTKPFGTRELLARLRGLLRDHGTAERGAVIEVADLRVDAAVRTAALDGVPLRLTRREFDLLWLLA